MKHKPYLRMWFVAEEEVARARTDGGRGPSQGVRQEGQGWFPGQHLKKEKYYPELTRLEAIASRLEAIALRRVSRNRVHGRNTSSVGHAVVNSWDNGGKSCPPSGSV